MIPYYLIKLHDAFDLVCVFTKLENLRVIFFKLLTEILTTVPRSFLFKQIQIYCLGAILFWTSHSQSKNFFYADHALNNQIKYQSKSILDNLTETNDSCLYYKFLILQEF